LKKEKHVLYANPWWHDDFIYAVKQEADARGWFLDLQLLLSGGKLPQSWKGDGILTHLGGDLDQLEDLRRKAGCPVVALSLEFPEFDAVRVSMDFKAAGRMAAEHFLERGFESFAFYCHTARSRGSSERYAGFHDRVREAGYFSHMIDRSKLKGENPSAFAVGQRRLSTRLLELPHPLAVFALNDMAATEVIDASFLANLHIPDQIAVLGMMDMPIFRSTHGIALSSINDDLLISAQIACDTLGKMMEGNPHEPKMLIPPTGIQVRASTDTLASESPIVMKTVRYMFDHYRDQMCLKTLCHVAGLSKTTLYDYFHQEFGKTPYGILTQIRIDRAKIMLSNTDDKIRAIADDCGFGTSVNFYRQFKKHSGQSPDEYRKAHRDQK
jgi:LacI family transcriptional regulator